MEYSCMTLLSINWKTSLNNGGYKRSVVSCHGIC